MPSPRIPASPREAPSSVQDISAPSRVTRRAASPPGPRSSEMLVPDAVSTVIPARPGALWCGSGSSRSSTSLRRPLARPYRAPFVSHRASPGSQPSREASQPKKQHPGDHRVGPVARRHRADPPQLPAPARRVEGGGHPLAPRRRAQPGEVDHVGALRQLARALRRGGGVRLHHGVDQHHLGQPQQRVHAPRGARAATTTTVARSLTTSGSTIVSICSRCCSPMSTSTSSWQSASSPGAGSPSTSSSPRRRSSCGPARPRRGSAARGGSGRPARAG